MTQIKKAVGITDKDIESISMQIIHLTNERFGVDVRTRQALNDELIDYAIGKISGLFSDGGGAARLVPPYRPERNE